jgi:hypothetical protein
MLTARQALELATIGGAAVLGREDIGALAPGRCADFAAFDLRSLAYAGGWHDPVAALVFCAPQTAQQVYVHGRPVVEQGRLVTVEVPPILKDTIASRKKWAEENPCQRVFRLMCAARWSIAAGLRPADLVIRQEVGVGTDRRGGPAQRRGCAGRTHRLHRR